MNPLGVAIGLSAAGSFVGLLAASTLLAFPDRVRGRLVSWLISFAVGTLLSAALLKLLPEALAQVEPRAAFSSLLVGILTFFVLEKLVLWRHCHEPEDCALHVNAAPLVLVGDAVHTFVDGAIIGAAVLSSVPLGISTAVAVIAHEVPQELGDFAILLQAGYSRRRALSLNLLAGFAGIAGAISVYAALGATSTFVPHMLAFAAGNFLYVAMSDLIPSLHRGQVDASALRQIGLVTLGVLTLSAL